MVNSYCKNEIKLSTSRSHIMKNILASAYWLPTVLAGALLFVTGCNTVSISSKQYLGGPRYAPSNPASVEILRTEPTKPHVKLGEVQAQPSSDSVPIEQIETALRTAAAKLGADAVVVVYDKTQVVGAVVTGPGWGRSVSTITGRVIIAVAIKYQ
jgi:hypothetical protein